MVISRRAEQDLVGILEFTFVEFGLRQVQKYSAMLDEGLKIILKSPSIGHKRRDLPGNMLVYPVGQHLIVYNIEANERSSEAQDCSA